MDKALGFHVFRLFLRVDIGDGSGEQDWTVSCNGDQAGTKRVVTVVSRLEFPEPYAPPSPPPSPKP